MLNLIKADKNVVCNFSLIDLIVNREIFLMVNKYIRKALFCINMNKVFSLCGEIYGKDRVLLDKLTGLQNTKFILLSIETQQMSPKISFIQKPTTKVG